MTEKLQQRERTNPLGVLGAKARQPSGAQHLLGLAAILFGAKRPADFVAPVHAELAAAARLESIFTSPQ
jgi:hypothetical protein